MSVELPPAIVDAESVTAWSDYVRDRVKGSSSIDDGVVRGPDWVIDELENVSAAAGVAVLVVKDADVVRRRAARDLAAARARVQGEAAAAGGRVADIAARVEQLVAGEAEAADLAEAAYDYARAVARLVEGRKSAVQTIGRMVEITYSLAGSRRSA